MFMIIACSLPNYKDTEPQNLFQRAEEDLKEGAPFVACANVPSQTLSAIGQIAWTMLVALPFILFCVLPEKFPFLSIQYLECILK